MPMPQDQSDKIHSKLKLNASSDSLVLASGVVAALAIASSAVTMAPPLTGRLHPGLVPGGLALALLVAAVIAVIAAIEPHSPGSQAEAAQIRSVIAAAAAVVILAFGVGTLGIFVAAFLAATIAAAGVSGVTLRRALLTGLCLSAAISLVFALALRQPLPILPPALPR
jgi:hypothetical protein